jgi:hypothetical protein
MRFVPEGPSIPDELLEQCDNGNVVFFCGAGVSQSAGLPSFLELTKRVAHVLGAADRPDLLRLSEPLDTAPNLDQVFNFLQLEYGRDQVENAVSRILRTPRHANVEAHSIIHHPCYCVLCDSRPLIGT